MAEFPLQSRCLGGSDKQGGEMVQYNDAQINRDAAKIPHSDNGGCKHGTKSFLFLRQNMKPNPYSIINKMSIFLPEINKLQENMR